MARKGKSKAEQATEQVEAEPDPQESAGVLPMNILDYIETPWLPGFQKMFKGVPDGAITAFLGAPGACKSMMAYQLGVNIAHLREGNMIIVDTENNWQQYGELANGLGARFGVDIHPILVTATVKETGSAKKETRKQHIEWEFNAEPREGAIIVFVIREPDFVPISVMHGRSANLTIFDSGKFKTVMDSAGWADDIADSPLGQFIEEYNVKVTLYDSITNPMDEIPAVTENFPGRADMTQSWMIQIQKFASHYKMPILATFHESKNDASQFSKALKIEGGKGVAYNIKFCVYLLVQNEPGLLPKGAPKPHPLSLDERAMFIARHAGRGRWRKVRYFQIAELEDETPAGLMETDEDDEE